MATEIHVDEFSNPSRLFFLAERLTNGMASQSERTNEVPDELPI